MKIVILFILILIFLVYSSKKYKLENFIERTFCSMCSSEHLKKNKNNEVIEEEIEKIEEITPIPYSRAKNRNFIYKEPAVVNMLNTIPPTSEEIIKLQNKKYEDKINNLLEKQIRNRKQMEKKRAIINYNNQNKQYREKCLPKKKGKDKYCLVKGINHNYCYKKPKNYCLVKGIDKQYCIEAINNIKCPNSKNYDNPYCI